MVILENSKFAPVYDSENRSIYAESQDHYNSIKHILNKYFSDYPHSIYENIYVNKQNGTLFSAAQTITHGLDSINHHFVGMRHEFLSGNYNNKTTSKLGIVKQFEMTQLADTLEQFYKKQRVNSKSTFYKESEYTLGTITDLNFSEQDSVLIVGGGPSSNTVDLSYFYDKPVWAMNNFYNHKDAHKFKNIQLMPLLDDVDIKNQRLIDFIKNQKPHLIQEITDYGLKRMKSVLNISDGRWGISHTRYRSKLGVGARLIALACNLRIKNIYFCGIDGYDMNSKITHAFEKNKGIPRWLKLSGKTVQDEQFLIFFDYIFNLCKLFKLSINDLSKSQNSIQYKFIYET